MANSQASELLIPPLVESKSSVTSRPRGEINISGTHEDHKYAGEGLGGGGGEGGAEWVTLQNMHILSLIHVTVLCVQVRATH